MLLLGILLAWGIVTCSVCDIKAGENQGLKFVVLEIHDEETMLLTLHIMRSASGEVENRDRVSTAYGDSLFKGNEIKD